MLLGNKCVENIERDIFIQDRALASVSEIPSTHDMGDNLMNLEKRLTDLVDQNVGEAMKTTCEKVEKNIRCRSRRGEVHGDR